MNNVLEVNKLNKKYPSFSLNDVSFSLEPGKIYGFIGRNGAGKTTTLKCIYNLIKRDSGDILFNGKSIFDIEEEAKNDIGLLFGGIDYYPNAKVSTIAEVTSRFYKKWDHERFLSLIRFFEIDINKKVKNLSNGMKVKFGLALALSHGAKILLLDEPTSGLDPVSRDEVLECFMKIVQKGETSILFSTHVISDLEKCADEIIYIKSGNIVNACSVENFKKSYLRIEGRSVDLRIENKDKIGHYNERNGIFTGVILAKHKEDFINFNLDKPSLEDIMLFIERGNENEESPF